MAPPRDALALEIALDRLEAELATQLPGHVRAFARAHAAGLAPPPAPRAASRPSSVALAREALTHPALAARATALLRLIAPLAIDADPSVAPLRAASPSWPALAALAAARDRVARAWLGLPYVALHHALHVGPLIAAPPAHPAFAHLASEHPGAVSPGSGRPASERPVSERPAAPERPVSERPMSERPAAPECPVSERAVSEPPASERPVSEPLSGQSVVVPEHLASGAAASERPVSEPLVSGRLERISAADADLRALRAAAEVEIPGWTAPGPPLGRAAIEARWRELARRHGARGAVHIVESAVARPRAFVVEPGREVILVVPANAGTPAARFAVLHELGHAVAALLEPGGLPRAVDEAVAAYVARDQEVPEDPVFSPLAAAARQRRTAIAQLLERVERALPAPLDIGSAAPPWALWHDAGAQTSYVAAEQLADRWWRELRATPGPGALARALAEARATVDGATVDGTAVDGAAVGGAVLPRG
ncbi:MAG: hypothetical protein ACTHU0_06245 [Kofleriaceae bacterium]